MKEIKKEDVRQEVFDLYGTYSYSFPNDPVPLKLSSHHYVLALHWL